MGTTTQYFGLMFRDGQRVLSEAAPNNTATLSLLVTCGILQPASYWMSRCLCPTSTCVAVCGE
eukprot:7847388-Prorocentrum_lima.AAC.1